MIKKDFSLRSEWYCLYSCWVLDTSRIALLSGYSNWHYLLLYPFNIGHLSSSI